MYVIELALKMSPFPLAVQRKNLDDAKSTYHTVRESLEKGLPKVLELNCEQLKDKKIAVLTSELLSVQIYEKTGVGGGIKRPGFSFDE
ncbi:MULTISPECIES: hypothetical protein [Prochlorococcus]|uniref:hypothetical protein n=1 Tax=Prochlorococcus TaxID=1218 RepID=UPI00053380BD|nr:MULTISPECIES: hypothetical protein [Prochlorococcus]KGG13251.1 hypothetical protein EV05_0930 [Prochlorococcus sp. MIT 0601]